MKKNKIITLFVLAGFLVACDTGNSNSQNKESGDAFEINDQYYQNVSKRINFDTQNELNFNQTFENGLNNDVWYTLDGVWHTDVPHNGMKRRNLFYTNDGTKDYLAIRGRGIYNRDADFDTEEIRPEGGCIVSKNHLGPGRYEIKMAPMPREGAVSTMWTYCTATGNEATSQNEIDIEIGGTTKGTHYKYLWATTWTKHGTKQTETPDISEMFYMNDRKIHTYTFDWYTEYPSTKERRIDWFVDGHFIQSLTGNIVPEHEMPLWVGLWFPPLWTGNPTFEEDYMLVESISYQSFEGQYYEDCRAQPGYEKHEIKDVDIQTIDFDRIKNVNKLSNSGFEVFEQNSRGNNSYYGWSVDTASDGTITQSNDASQGSKSFMLTAPVTPTSKYSGEYIYQDLTDAYEGFKYELKIDAKKVTSDAEGGIWLYYYDATSNAIANIEKIDISSTNFETYTKQITMPKNSYRLRVELNCTKGSILYDNASLKYLGND